MKFFENFNKKINSMIKEDSINYDPYKYPPDINICEQHLQATNFNNTVNTKKKCEDCNFSYNIKEYVISEKIDHFSENGSGYSLFFYFYKFIIILWIFPLLINSLYYSILYFNGHFCSLENYNSTDIHINSPPSSKKKAIINQYCNDIILINDDNCDKYYNLNCNLKLNYECNMLANTMIDNFKNNKKCSPKFYNKLAFSNILLTSKDKDSKGIKDGKDGNIIPLKGYFIDFLTSIIILAMFFLWHELEEYKILHYDKQNLTMKDFTVKLENLPKYLNNMNTKKYTNYLKYYIENLKDSFGNKFRITNIILGYNLENYQQIQNLIEKEKKKIIDDIIKSSNKPTDEKNLIPISNNSINPELIYFYNKMKNNTWDKLTGKAFVSFETELMTYEFLKKYKKQDVNIFNKIYDNNDDLIIHFENLNYTVKASQAKEPTDIFWFNLHYYKLGRRFRKYFSTLILLIVYMIFFLFIIKITMLNQYYDDKAEDNGITINDIMSILTSLFIVFFNSVFSYIIKLFIGFEKHQTISKNLSNEINMIYRIQLFNSSMPILISAIYRLNFFGKSGLLLYLNFLFLSNIFIPPILEFFNLSYILKLFYRYIIRNKTKNCKFTQQDANKIFENDTFDISSKYAFILQSISLALFYLPIFPLSIIYCLISLIIKYFVDKYILIRRSNKKLEYSEDMSLVISSELRYLFLYYCIGIIVRDIILTYWINNDPNITFYSFFIFFMGLFNLLFDIPKIFSDVHKDIKIHFKGLYSNMILSYPYNYYMSNPYYNLKKELKLLINN